MFEYKYVGDRDEVVVYYDGDEIGAIDSPLERVENGILTDPDIRPIIYDYIQSAGTPERIEKQTSLSLDGVSQH